MIQFGGFSSLFTSDTVWAVELNWVLVPLRQVGVLTTRTKVT